jgi:hypothetical protein
MRALEQFEVEARSTILPAPHDSHGIGDSDDSRSCERAGGKIVPSGPPGRNLSCIVALRCGQFINKQLGRVGAIAIIARCLNPQELVRVVVMRS